MIDIPKLSSQLLAIAALAGAAPWQGTAPEPGSIVDTYDDLPASIAAGLPQVGAYHGLLYGGWAVGASNDVENTAGGVIPQSGKQVAVAVTPLTTGRGNPGTVANGAGTTCFDLESFYFGCILQTLGPIPDAASACTISVTGYRGNDMVGEAPFDFGQPSNPLAAPMSLADLSGNPNYKCISNVTISISSGTEVLLLIDNLVHKNYW